MTPLFTPDQFKSARSRALLPLECKQCHQTFQRTKNAIQCKKPSYCSPTCAGVTHIVPRAILTCSSCGVSFERKQRIVDRHKRMGVTVCFCSKQCRIKNLRVLRPNPTVLTEEQTRQLCDEVRANPDLRYTDLARKYGVKHGHTIRTTLLRNGVNLPSRRGLFVFPNHRFLKIRSTALKAGYVFEIDKQYLHDLFFRQGEACPYTGWKLTFDSQSRLHDGTASLDRIDSTKGYIEGNVQWVHKHINAMKLWHTQEDFLELCKAVVRHHGTSASAPASIQRVQTLRSISTNKWRETRLAPESV